MKVFVWELPVYGWYLKPETRDQRPEEGNKPASAVREKKARGQVLALQQ